MNLSSELRVCLEELSRSIEAVKAQAELRDIDPYCMVTPAGTLVMAPLLAAKAACLNALAHRPEAS